MSEGKKNEGSRFGGGESGRERDSVRECAEKSLRCRHSSEDDCIYIYIYIQRECV